MKKNNIFKLIHQWQLLINFIRKMILRLINLIQENVLTTYHLTFNFQTREEKFTYYKLELLAELRNEKEMFLLDGQIKHQLIDKFDNVNSYQKEIKTQYERQQIENDFNDKLKNHISMKFIFRQWVKTFDLGEKTIKVIDKTIEPNGIKDYRANILKSGKIPFSAINDMFCIEINTTEFK